MDSIALCISGGLWQIRKNGGKAFEVAECWSVEQQISARLWTESCYTEDNHVSRTDFTSWHLSSCHK
jgi:hypothetical protein